MINEEPEVVKKNTGQLALDTKAFLFSFFFSPSISLSVLSFPFLFLSYRVDTGPTYRCVSLPALPLHLFCFISIMSQSLTKLAMSPR